jgi:hypothetical protein
MKLDRNGKDGLGKYAVVKLRKIGPGDDDARAHLEALITGGFVEVGSVGDIDEFFVIKLKDRFAAPALMAYAEAAAAVDPEYAIEVMELAARAVGHPNRKTPD